MGVAAAIAGAAVVGAGATIISGNKAAGAAKDAAKMSADTERYIYDTTRADYAPYRAVGVNALGQLARLYGVPTEDTTATPAPTSGVAGNYGGGFGGIAGRFGEIVRGGITNGSQPTTQRPATPTVPTDRFGGFTASPSYQWRLEQGLKAIERRASANGARYSGATLKAMDRYAGGEASQEFDTYANRLAALAGVGQTATGSVAQAGQSYATGASNAYTNAGNARASAYTNTGNAINQGVQNLASAYLYNKGYQAPPTAGTPTNMWYGRA